MASLGMGGIGWGNDTSYVATSMPYPQSPQRRERHAALGTTTTATQEKQFQQNLKIMVDRFAVDWTALADIAMKWITVFGSPYPRDLVDEKGKQLGLKPLAIRAKEKGLCDLRDGNHGDRHAYIRSVAGSSRSHALDADGQRAGSHGSPARISAPAAASASAPRDRNVCGWEFFRNDCRDANCPRKKYHGITDLTTSERANLGKFLKGKGGPMNEARCYECKIRFEDLSVSSQETYKEQWETHVNKVATRLWDADRDRYFQEKRIRELEGENETLKEEIEANYDNKETLQLFRKNEASAEKIRMLEDENQKLKEASDEMAAAISQFSPILTKLSDGFSKVVAAHAKSRE